MKGNGGDGGAANGGCGVQVLHTGAQVNKSPTHTGIVNVSGFGSTGSRTKANTQ